MSQSINKIRVVTKYVLEDIVNNSWIDDGWMEFRREVLDEVNEYIKNIAPDYPDHSLNNVYFSRKYLDNAVDHIIDRYHDELAESFTGMLNEAIYDEIKIQVLDDIRVDGDQLDGATVADMALLKQIRKTQKKVEKIIYHELINDPDFIMDLKLKIGKTLRPIVESDLYSELAQDIKNELRKDPLIVDEVKLEIKSDMLGKLSDL